MSTAQTLLSNAPGPLPISIQYTPESDEPVTILFAGSVQSHDIATMQVGFDLKVNGETIGQSMINSSSSVSYHFATVPAMVNTSLPFNLKDDQVEPVTIQLSASNNDSNTDKTDLFNVCIIN